MRTLCVDIGGTGIKAMVLDASGAPLTERHRVETPQPAVPAAVIDAIEALVAPMGGFERVAVGYPGVVVDGVTHTGHNLGEGWIGFDLVGAVESRLGRPARAANDAGVQGLGVIEGRGTEVVITLGTGMGFGLYIDGKYVPNIEMAHHPFDGKKTYEERIGDRARKKVGLEKWSRRVLEAIDQLRPILNWRRLYLGGGNAKRIDPALLPADVVVVDNTAGILGGVKLWGESPPAVTRRKRTQPTANA